MVNGRRRGHASTAGQVLNRNLWLTVSEAHSQCDPEPDSAIDCIPFDSLRIYITRVIQFNSRKSPGVHHQLSLNGNGSGVPSPEYKGSQFSYPLDAIHLPYRLALLELPSGLVTQPCLGVVVF